eukprot:gene48261-38973_t
MPSAPPILHAPHAAAAARSPRRTGASDVNVEVDVDDDGDGGSSDGHAGGPPPLRTPAAGDRLTAPTDSSGPGTRPQSAKDPSPILADLRHQRVHSPHEVNTGDSVEGDGPPPLFPPPLPLLPMPLARSAANALAQSPNASGGGDAGPDASGKNSTDPKQSSSNLQATHLSDGSGFCGMAPYSVPLTSSGAEPASPEARRKSLDQPTLTAVMSS